MEALGCHEERLCWVQRVGRTSCLISASPLLTFHSKGEKITAKAHGGPIDIQGVTVATVDDAVRLQAVDTWFDPLEMFRQIAPGGVVNKEIMNRKVEPTEALEIVVPQNDGLKIAQEHNDPSSEHANEPAPEDVLPKHISNGTGEPADAFVPHQGADTEEAAEKVTSDPSEPAKEIVASAAENGADAELSKPASNFDEATAISTNGDTTTTAPEQNVDQVVESRVADEQNVDQIVECRATGQQNGDKVDESRATGTYDAVDEHLESSAEKVHPRPRDMEETVKPAAGEAVAAPADSTETKMTHEEMSKLGSAGECPFLMNRE